MHFRNITSDNVICNKYSTCILIITHELSIHILLFKKVQCIICIVWISMSIIVSHCVDHLEQFVKCTTQQVYHQEQF